MQQRGGNNLANQGPRTPSSLGPDGGPPSGMHPSQQQQQHMHMQQQQQQMDGRFPGGGGPGGPGGSPFGAGGVGPKMGGGVNFMDMNSPNGKSGDGVSDFFFNCCIFVSGFIYVCMMFLNNIHSHDFECCLNVNILCLYSTLAFK